jgi:hypothetical protein
MQEDFTAYIRLPLVYHIRGSISISRLNVIKTTPRYMVLVMLDPFLILFTFRLKAEGNSLLLLHFLILPRGAMIESLPKTNLPTY